MRRNRKLTKNKKLFSTLHCSTLCPTDGKAQERQKEQGTGPFRTEAHIWLERED
ncbi:PREDICTED: uncharacterized protein LOC103601678 [Galeopterus variegatus]|uniref:Uncharacterized protein LOC103601678 n=1 Tax=Galeopterus variegatus TaxID=482537 RepID=A0ABM0RUM8_GALVR|nr:PREDICTED: uncharacterized protein LOC103601678 [Galeopterus variegatus]